MSPDQWKSSSTAIQSCIRVALIVPCMKALRHLLYSRPMTNATPPDDSDVGIVICAAWFHYVCVHYEYLWQILIWLIQQLLASLIRTLNVPAGLARAVMNSLGVGNLCSCLRWASFCLASPCCPCSGSYAFGCICIVLLLSAVTGEASSRQSQRTHFWCTAVVIAFFSYDYKGAGIRWIWLSCGHLFGCPIPNGFLGCSGKLGTVFEICWQICCQGN